MTNILNYLRDKRGFNEKEYLALKVSALADFFKLESLDSVVLGLSGGIDSALALALMLEVTKLPNSPLKKVVGIAMPIYGDGSTGQDNALNRAKLLSQLYKNNDSFVFLERDLTTAYQEYGWANKRDSKWSQLFPTTPFANGQLLSIVRTPFLYYTAALLQESGYCSITCGTTNRDEGAYIGFFGKASDAMVDLQPIGDLHKSEVVRLAKYLSVPIEIINEKPRGDVYDGRVDEEMIGTTYDNVEYYALLKDYKYLVEDYMDVDSLSAINAIHAKNAHKYLVGLPSRFVDVLPRVLEGGWK